MLQRPLARFVLLAVLAATLLPAQLAARDTSIAVIVNSRNSRESISLAELRSIFLGTQAFWKDGEQVVPVVRAPSARERDVLLRRVVHMTEIQFQDYWRKITGEKRPRAGRVRGPIVVVSNGMQLETVSKESGGIALVAVSDVKSGVKVLKVGGLLPGKAGYPLKTTAVR